MRQGARGKAIAVLIRDIITASKTVLFRSTGVCIAASPVLMSRIIFPETALFQVLEFLAAFADTGSARRITVGAIAGDRECACLEIPGPGLAGENGERKTRLAMVMAIALLLARLLAVSSKSSSVRLIVAGEGGQSAGPRVIAQTIIPRVVAVLIVLPFPPGRRAHPLAACMEGMIRSCAQNRNNALADIPARSRQTASPET